MTKIPLYNRILVAIAAIIWIYASLCFTMVKPYDETNTTKVTCHVKAVKTYRSKTSSEYWLYAMEQDTQYIIDATDVADRFSGQGLITSLKPGQLVVLFLNRDSFWWPQSPTVVSLSANNVNYLTFDHSNEHLDSKRIFMPLMGFICLLGFVLVVYKGWVSTFFKR